MVLVPFKQLPHIPSKLATDNNKQIEVDWIVCKIHSASYNQTESENITILDATKREKNCSKSNW